MKKKVLFLITKSNWGGAQRYVYDLATALDTDRYEVVVALGGEGDLQTKLVEANIKTTILPHMSNTLSAKKLFSIIKETTTFLTKESPDILHCNSSIAGFAGVVAGRRAGVPNIVFTAHGWAFNEDRSYLQKIIFKFFHWLTVLLSHQTIAVSKEITRQLNWPFLGHKWVVIHNGRKDIDFMSRDQARQFLNLSTDALVTGTIAELHPVKQHVHMIRVVAQLKKRGHSLTHVIIGAGRQEQALRQLVSELQLESDIVFAGAIYEAARYLRAFDIYVQPSRSEALGYTVIEAAQAGLPIVASDVGGIPEIITNNIDGLLVPSADVAALGQAVETLINDTVLRTRLASAATTTSDRFSFWRMVEATRAVYDDTKTS